MWGLPGPGIELTSPALAGGFLTTGSPGKSGTSDFKRREGSRDLKVWISSEHQFWEAGLPFTLNPEKEKL